jgi:hypothetical protein
MTEIDNQAEIARPSRSVVDEVRDCMARYIAALGGDDAVTDEQRAACKRAAELVTLATALRYKALAGKEVAVAEFVRVEDLADEAVSRLMLPKAKVAEPKGLEVAFVTAFDVKMRRWIEGHPNLERDEVIDKLASRITELEAALKSAHDGLRSADTEIKRLKAIAAPAVDHLRDVETSPGRREPRHDETEISRRLRGLPSPNDGPWDALAKAVGNSGVAVPPGFRRGDRP